MEAQLRTAIKAKLIDTISTQKLAMGGGWFIKNYLPKSREGLQYN